MTRHEMRKYLMIAVLTVPVFSSTAAVGEERAAGVCAGYDISELTEAKPVVRVEPAFGDELREDSVDSCIVVTFGLKAKRGTNGQALLAHKPKAVAWSDEVPRSARRAAQRALEKWLFLAKTQPASDDPAYYYVFTF